MQVDKKSIVVVIPMYRSSIGTNEKISLEQVLKVLSDYDIYFVVPETLSFHQDQLIPSNPFLKKTEEPLKLNVPFSTLTGLKPDK